jgi:hypothetical protein
MANTYQLISSNTVGSGGVASVTFSSIPGTYTDLKVVLSTRNSAATSGNFSDYLFNSTIPTGRTLYGNGASAASDAGQYGHIDTGNSATANTFANSELYIPNYASANNKSFSVDGVSENNATTGFNVLSAGIASTTAVITSLTFSPQSGSFVQHCTFYLYGIKNS